MSITRRIINAVRPTRQATAPEPGRLIKTRREDTWRDYPADGLTPSRLGQILRAADDGALDAAMQLYEQMEEKDAHLFSVAHTRRLALTGLDWEVVSAAEVRDGVDRSLADEAANYCRRQLARLETFDEVLQHLAMAVGRNIAVAELVWEAGQGGHRLAEIVPVDFTRLTFDELDRPRVLTQEQPYDGIALAPNKFVVHTPFSCAGHASRGGLLRVSALAFLGKHYALRDWLVFAEVYGMPIRLARYEPSASAEEKRELLGMLQQLGSDAAGIFSKAVELELIEPKHGGQGGSPYEKLCGFLNHEMSKAWLGQTLTTDTTGAAGTLTASQVHDRVRRDLREDDIRKEGRTIRRDVLRPMAQLKYGMDVPVPHFRRKLERPRDLRELADVLAVAANELGIQVPRKWAHQMLGIPEPSEGEEVLKG
jgi:phage gp29-like protein